MAEKAKSGRGLGVDVFIPDFDLESPLCPHGPTVIFERFFKDRSSRKFFACSASRDRKGCSFFQWVDEKITTGKTLLQNEIKNQLQAERDEVEESLHMWEELSSDNTNGNINFCLDCSVIIHHNTTSSQKHDSHNLKKLSSSDVQEPSKFMTPAENKKTNAQFLFSDKSCDFIVNLLKNLGYEKVICLGVPRIHEKFQKLKKRNENKLDSILLDLDKRYAQFFGSSFIRYNMFVNYFFGGERSEQNFKQFLEDSDPGKIALVMDPPFGGVLSLLSSSLDKLLQLRKDKEARTENNELAILMIFPYFLETHVQESFPALKMMDYKICYKNHPTYKEKVKKTQRGSPIRIFSNIPCDNFVLPKNEGYRFCKKCHRYVSEENKHCEKCNACTSKDGRTYVHCDLCEKCVKPGRIHCSVCNKCEEKIHQCGTKNQDPLSCHVCGEIGHKRRNCPTKTALKRLVKDEETKPAKKSKTVAKKTLKKSTKK